MKTNTSILLTFFMLFSLASFGQTKEETIQWLNVQKANYLNVYGIYCNSEDTWLSRRGTHKILTFTENSIRIHYELTYSGYKEFSIDWKDIISIIHFESYYEGSKAVIRIETKEGNYIGIPIKNSQMISKVEKALTHMATISGANLVKNDLFED